jgi:hypothetical protein
MTEEQIALGRRAVACKGWRWMPGMRQLVASNRAPYRVVCDGYAPPEDEFVVMSECGDPEVLPDLTDPATFGCLLALVREAWGKDVVIRFGNEWWEIEAERFLSDDTYTASLAESLVAALEAAPCTTTP